MSGPKYLSTWVLFKHPPGWPAGSFVICEQRCHPDGCIEHRPKDEARVFPKEEAAYTWGQLADLGYWIDRTRGDDARIIGAWL